MTLRRQVGVAFAAVAFVGALCAVLVTHEALDLERALTEVLEDNVPATRAARGVEIALSRAVVEAERHLLTAEPEAREHVAVALDDARLHLEAYCNVIARAAPSQRKMADAMRENQRALARAIERMDAAVGGLNSPTWMFGTPEELHRHVMGLARVYDDAQASLRTATNRERDELEANGASSFAQAVRMRQIAIAAGMMLVVLGLLLPAVIVRVHMPRIRRLVRISEALATGDLSQRVAIDSGDEIGLLGAAIDDMAEHLETSLQRERELAALRSHFVSMASHEFRTPLTAILAAAQSLDRYADRMTPEQRTTRVTNIVSQVRVMTQLLDDVLTYGRAGSGRISCEPEVVDVRSFCERLVDEVQGTVATAERVLLTVRENVSVARVDPKLLRQILGNVLTNALKYSPEQEQVIFSVDGRDDETTFRVADFGIGIPQADQEFLFEPFHRASNVGDRPGTGLGLAITKQAIDLHGGTVAVESADGRGTTVVITIPHATGEAE